MEAAPYFAYGSNLNLDDYAARGFDPGQLQVIGRAMLPDWALGFWRFSHGRQAGVLNIQRRLGAMVPGLLYTVRPAGWEDLDCKEGAPRHYQRVPVVVLDESGAPHAAITYVAPVAPFVAPAPAYRDAVLAGMIAQGVGDAAVFGGIALGQDAPMPGLFVYGNLRSGQSRERFVGPGPRRPATTAGVLVNCGAYPALLPGSARVVGEWVALDDPARLTRLDAIEGFYGHDRADNLYRRVLVPVEVDGAPRWAWTYRYAAEDRGWPVIESGDWLRRSAEAWEPA